MPLPKNPTVALYFTGLLVFCFEKEFKYCQIGIHSKTDDHELKLRLVKKTTNPKSGSEQNITIPHEMIRSTKDLWLDIEGTPPPKQQTVKPFIVGKRNQPPSDPQDFRHVVDLEGKHFYDRQLKIRRGVLIPSIFIAKGLFYTAALTSRSYRTILASNDSDHSHGHSHTASPLQTTGNNLGRIADTIGVNLYLDRIGQAVVLRAGRNGAELLRITKEKNTSYEITIDNGPNDRAPAGNHFGHYYDALQLNAGESKMLIQAESNSEKTGIKGFTGAECWIIQLGKSNGLGRG